MRSLNGIKMACHLLIQYWVGPAVRIKREWVKAICKMKSGKATGPSGIVAEMFKDSVETGIDLVTELSHMTSDQGVHWNYCMLLILC